MWVDLKAPQAEPSKKIKESKCLRPPCKTQTSITIGWLRVLLFQTFRNYGSSRCRRRDAVKVQRAPTTRFQALGRLPAARLGALGGFVGGSVALIREKRGWFSHLQVGQSGEVLVQNRDAP